MFRRSLLALPTLLATRARAEEAWPFRPVRIVIPFGAGGPIDTVGRLLAELLRDRLGQPFLIDNRPGAGGSIGIRTVIQSPADGTVLLLTSASLASVPALYPGQGLDPRTALTPVSLVADIPTAMVVRADGPWRSVQDVVAGGAGAAGDADLWQRRRGIVEPPLRRALRLAPRGSSWSTSPIAAPHRR